MNTQEAERRQAKRYAMEVPLRFGDDEGRTLNLSSRGVYFLSATPLEAGSAVDIDVTLTNACAHGPITLHMHGRVIRVDQLEATLGVAAVIESWDVADSTPEQVPQL
jgi:hypothetical protein